MPGNNSHSMTMNSFLWSVFCLNILVFVFAIWFRSDWLILIFMMNLLFIVIMHKKHQNFIMAVNLRPNNTDSENYSFIKYVRNILRGKSSMNAGRNKNSVLNTSIEFSINPNIAKQECLIHSIYPAVVSKKDFKVRIGNDKVDKPFNSSILTLDIPDYALLSHEMLVGLDRATTSGGFAYSANEYKVNGLEEANVILKTPINNGHEFFSGNSIYEWIFNQASGQNIKAIELYFDSPFNSCFSLSEMMNNKRNLHFNSIPTLLNFLRDLREYVIGKPIGIRLAIGIGKQNEFVELCKAMKERRIFPDFISIVDESNSVSTGESRSYLDLEHAISFASATIKKFKLEKEVKLIAVGTLNNGFDLLKFIALGADACMTIRSIRFFMDNSDHYFNEDSPSYIKSRILYSYRNILRETVQLMEYAGIDKMDKIHPKMFFRKGSLSTVKNFEEIYFKNIIYQSEIVNKNFMYN